MIAPVVVDSGESIVMKPVAPPPPPPPPTSMFVTLYAWPSDASEHAFVPVAPLPMPPAATSVPS